MEAVPKGMVSARYNQEQDEMISVLITVSDIYRCIDTLENITRNTPPIETIIRLKENDLEALSNISSLPHTRYIIGRDNGLNTHEDINELCRVATGDILMPMHEHTEIFTKGWSCIDTDEVSIVHLGELGVCPGITRKVYEAMGHYAQHSDYISYITGVGNVAGINVTVPVQIRTKREEVTNEYDFRGRGIQTLIDLDAGRIKDDR